MFLLLSRNSRPILDAGPRGAYKDCFRALVAPAAAGDPHGLERPCHQMENNMTKQQEIVGRTNQYLIPNYGRLPIAMVRGLGARIWDADGKEYIDFFAGFGAGGVTGHSHPAVAAAVTDQAGKLQCCGNLFTNEPQVELAKRITENAFGGKVFFCHSGAEANEAALKLARLAAGEGRYKIISFNNCFHGRTMGALSLTPEKFQKGFEPMLPGCIKVDMGDIKKVQAAVDDQTAGIFIDPIQGEGGMNVPDAQFMHALRKLCDDKHISLISDEVWNSPARTGKWFGHQLHGITPDIMTLGKACGGGLPVAAMVAAPRIQDVLCPGKHGCTLGGNPLCAAAGVATFKLIAEQNLCKQAADKGNKIMQAIRDARIGCVKEVRGAGMMIGIEVDKPGKEIFAKCMERGLLINVTQDTVVRLAPPIITEDDVLAKGLEILLSCMK
jgi:predicted acetylornithine/succinylornithine family transaminase